jgi:hypothetical protein
VRQVGGIAACFPLDVLLVHSSTLVVTTDGERLTCGGFSLDETVRFGILEFIADYFSGMCLSPKESDSGAIFRSTTHSGPPTLWAMIEDSTEEFFMASSE